MTRKILLSFAMVVMAALLAGCNPVAIIGGVPGGGPSVPSMDASKWVFRYGTGTPKSPSRAPVGWSFTWPAKRREVDYLMTDVTINAKEVASVTLSVEALSGNPVFKHRDGASCSAPAQVRVMLQVRNDDMRSQDGRWWSQKSYRLAPGEATVVTPITDLNLWSNVQGKKASERPTQFKSAMTKLGSVGLTFGGCFFGHGVTVEGGEAQMTVTEFIVR